jgi:hypothetical protein
MDLSTAGDDDFGFLLRPDDATGGWWIVFGVRYAGEAKTGKKICSALQSAGVEFIDENGGGAGVRLRKRQARKC